MCADRPTEDTYTTELISVIKKYLGDLNFDAEFNRTSLSGKPDVLLYYKNQPIAVIENKIPKIRLSDPNLNAQAIRYAKWYKENRNVKFYGVHNLKYLKLFKFVPRTEPQASIDEFISPTESEWVPISEVPFKIMPWVTSIEDFKQISDNRQARENLIKFFLNFKEILEGKTLDLSIEVIETIRDYIKQGATNGFAQMENFYRTNSHNVREIFENWRQKRGIEKPRNDGILREQITLMIKEQIYTFSLKVLFYYVLQSINLEMAEQLSENLEKIELSDIELFKNIFNMLFTFAIERSGDFEEVFGSNTVERLPFTSGMLPMLKTLVSYISQIRWYNISFDIIGRIFESLIYSERRHLLGQHYTETRIVDLILVATLRNPAKILDPSCGSGTFMVRALNYWKIKNPYTKKLYDIVEGVDIDKLAVMLAKINLYIQTLDKIENISDYIPKVHNIDLFKLALPSDYSYVTTNPPYTRQEEMTMAFYDGNYKRELMDTVDDIPNWSKRASIYAYFLIKAGKLLREKGRLGFIVENSWTNAEYGNVMKQWFLENFRLELVIESNVERWFEDAKIITNIIIAEKNPTEEYTTRFVYFLKPLSQLIEVTPQANDLTANQRYYESIENLFSQINSKELPENKNYEIFENSEFKVVLVKSFLLKKIEEKFGKWGIFRGGKKYLELLFQFLEYEPASIKYMNDIIDIKRGLTTNANNIFYLPSKYWEYSLDDDDFLVLKNKRRNIVRISKKYLKPLIRMSDLKEKNYELSELERIQKEDYVLWVENIEQVNDDGTNYYVEWAEKFIKEANETNGEYPSIFKKIKAPNKRNKWTNLNDRSKANFLLKNAIHKNFSIYLNNITEGQVDKRLFLGTSKVICENKTIFAILNSVITYIGMELIGRTNLGEGALDVNVVDYKRIPVIDPVWLEKTLKNKGKFDEFLETIDSLLEYNPKNIEEAVKNKLRIKMDEIILSALGFHKKDVKDFYRDLIKIVKFREERAKSIKQEKKYEVAS